MAHFRQNGSKQKNINKSTRLLQQEIFNSFTANNDAATLYGIGACLDDSPSLFFKLRKVNVDDLIGIGLQQ